jgi:hypothetical protein
LFDLPPDDGDHDGIRKPTIAACCRAPDGSNAIGFLMQMGRVQRESLLVGDQVGSCEARSRHAM